MKKHQFIRNIAAIAAGGALIAVLPFIANAEEAAGTMDTATTPTPSTRPIPMTKDGRPVPLPVTKDGRPVPSADARAVPVKLQATTRMENIQNNREIRNNLVEARTAISEQRDAMQTERQAMEKRLAEAKKTAEARVRAMLPVKGPAWAMGSTSPIKAGFEARFASTSEREGHEKWKDAKLEIFAKLQANLITQADHALSQLREARTKLAERITKAEQAGRDMTDAKAKLATADVKIGLAETAAKAIATFTPPVITSGAKIDTSSAVKLDKPREIGRDAIKALKDAKDALQDVVRAIARNMGLKVGLDGRITAASTATTTTP